MNLELLELILIELCKDEEKNLDNKESNQWEKDYHQGKKDAYELILKTIRDR